MKIIFEIATGVVSGVFMLGLSWMLYELYINYNRNQREIERLKKRLDKIDKQLECLEVEEVVVDD